MVSDSVCLDKVREEKERLREIYDAIAEEFDASRVESWKEVLEFLDSLPDASLILDVGCGTGRDTLSALRRRNEVVSLDFSLGQLKILSSKLKDMKRGSVGLILGDMRLLPFKDDVFDVVLAVASIHHLDKEEQKRFLSEMKRVLKPGGRFLISAWAFESGRFKGVKEQEVLVKWGKHKRYYYLFKKGELRSIVREEGLNVVKEFTSGMNHFVIGGK